MSYWRVRVDCYSKATHRAKPKRTIRWFIVEGTAYESIALDYAEKTAMLGPLWVSFEYREASKLTFPLEIK